MTDMNRIAQVQFLGECREVVSVRVHVVAGPRLARPSVAAAIVRDAAIAVRRDKEHLVCPRIGAERPSMTEHDRLSASTVLKIDLGPSLTVIV